MDGFLMVRLVSLVAFVLTLVAAARLCRRLGVGAWPRAFVLLFLAVDYNQFFYAMSGMETQMAVAILLWAVLATMDRRIVLAGVMYGLCFLVRPDFGLFVAPALISWLVYERRSAIKVGLITVGVVGPWVLFTTLYYGSPIPNTIEAKALRYHIPYPKSLSPGAWIDFVSTQVAARETWWHTFTPFLNNGFVVDAPLLPFFSAAIAALVIGLGIIGIAVTRSRPGWRPALVFLVVYAIYRMLALPEGYYEWYYPPFTALLVICGAAALTRLSTSGPNTTNAVAIGLVALFAWPLPALITLDSRVQHEIEAKVRVPLGFWLRENVPDNASVTSESAGYVGYYGRRKLYDYPGLTSKTALAAMKKLGWERNSIFEEVNALKSDYVVLRPAELEAFGQAMPETAALYTEVARFAVPKESSELSVLGTTYVNIDREFVIVKRMG